MCLIRHECLTLAADLLPLVCEDLHARVQALLQTNDQALNNDGTASFNLNACPAESNATADLPGVGRRSTVQKTVDYPGTDARAGAVVAGKYVLVEAIGEGGMGSVWRAKQTEPSRGS